MALSTAPASPIFSAPLPCHWLSLCRSGSPPSDRGVVVVFLVVILRLRSAHIRQTQHNRSLLGRRWL